jgi:hypothetical protein
VIAVQLTRQHVVDVLRRTGLPELAEEALRDLPDPVDSFRQRLVDQMLNGVMAG